MAHESFTGLLKEIRSRPGYMAEHLRMNFIADCLRLMKAQGVSRAELARRMGVSRAYVTKLLNGNANITLETLAKFSLALNANLHLAVTRAEKVLWFGSVDGGKKGLLRTARSEDWANPERFVKEEEEHATLAAHG